MTLSGIRQMRVHLGDQNLCKLILWPSPKVHRARLLDVSGPQSCLAHTGGQRRIAHTPLSL